MRRGSVVRCAAVIVLVLVAVLWGATDQHAVPASTSSRTTARPNTAAYASPGPFKVGYTSLRMSDRFIDVWYPADERATKSRRKASYDQRTPLPPDLKAFVPVKYNTVVTMDAYPDVKGSAKGPFPVVLFSHGSPAFRMASSALAAGVASWGLVVVSPDFVERGVVTQLPGQQPLTLDVDRDRRLLLASLDLVTEESRRRRSVLHGVIDGGRAAATGHSAGGTIAFAALDDSRVKVAVGWAPGGAAPGLGASKPTMVIGASGDGAVTPTALREMYAALPAPKRFVEIGESGHNSFTDLCLVIRAGGGLVLYAIENGLVNDSLAALLRDGCEANDLAPEKFFPIVQHFTVAEIRDALDLDRRPVGLGDGVARAFRGVEVTYEHEP